MLSNKWTSTDTVYNNAIMTGSPLYYEYVSKYRRVTVVGNGNGFELRVHYKGLPIKDWSRTYGVKEDAIAWAKTQADNRELLLGALTIKEAPGRRLI